MNARSVIERAMEWFYRLMPWFLGWWFLNHATDHYMASGDGWEALSILAVGWATYDYAKERGQRQVADALVRAFGRKARRR